MFKKIQTLFLALAVPALTFAAPVTVNLDDAETSVANAGTALIAVAVIMLGIGLVYKFITRK